jgi:stearoyl-CoA desaturase (delta-9 desaturase)
MSYPAHKFTEERPWEQPWWKPSKGNYLTFVYIIVIHILAVIGLVLYPIPSWRLIAIGLTVAIFGGLGTTVCYHRALAHRSLKLNRFIEQALIFFTIFNGNGSPLTWVANHRQHHAKADTIEDTSSPRHGGFWWAHLRWVYQWPPSEVKRWCPDLNRWPYRIWNLLAVPVIISSLAFGLLWSWKGFFWLSAIRLVYMLHFQMLVNSLLHMSPGVAAGQDSSRYIWWLGPFQLGAWGENWHRNHHNEASSARFSRYWKQIDVGWYFILFLEWLGLAWSVRRPKDERKTQK